MILYHFTSQANLRSIARSGVQPGRVRISEDSAIEAIWLTTREDPDGHGLEQGGPLMTSDERLVAKNWSGTLPPPGTRFPKSSEIRITVELSPQDPRLEPWLPWARRNLAPDLLALLHPAGSLGLSKAKSWRLYLGDIPGAAIRDIHRDRQLAAL